MAAERTRTGHEPGPNSAVLTFHSLDTSGSVISFAPELFRARMEALAESGPPVVPLLECLRRPGTIALTFDDGFVNFATEAWPVLRRLGLPVTLFVVSGRVGKTNGWNPRGAKIPELPLLDWPALRELWGGGVELGAHSHTHFDLTRVPGERLDDEFELPLRMIQERVGTRPRTFAYPYGKVSPWVQTKAAEYYQAACGTAMGYCRKGDNPHDVRRLDAYYLRGRVGPADVLCAGGMRWMTARGWARRLRSALGG